MTTFYNSTHTRVMLKKQKITARDWDIIRQLHAEGVELGQLALAFGVTRSYLRNMVR